jgi:glycosyltransferase involved in cell wall biosynthesis
LANPQNEVGIVVIGRNEGLRLSACLQSVVKLQVPVVYVDSGSTDESVVLAKAIGVKAIELDSSEPFSAARGRNVGFEWLRAEHPGLKFIQFLDGDCQIMDTWLTVAVNALHHHPRLAVVAGRLLEVNPSASIYNRLAELEWNSWQAGEVRAVGGIFCVRMEAFEQSGGFDATVVAGEETELCMRLLNDGWTIRRVDAPMAGHDLSMYRFSQWWKRSVRYGYGSADLAERFKLSRFRRINFVARFWGIWLLGLLAAAAMVPIAPREGVAAVLCMAIIWLAQWIRIARRMLAKPMPMRMSTAYALFVMLSFWAQIVGQLKYYRDWRNMRSPRIVEYKART